MSDKDLFGRDVFEPIKGEQLPLFHGPVNIERPDNDSPTDRKLRRKFAKTPTAPLFPARRPGDTEVELVGVHRGLPLIDKPEEAGSIRQRVEAELKRRRIPYVNVTEASRALFQPRTIDLRHCFHFVVYSQAGDNWLLLCGEAGESKRQAMTEWQAIFGDGFKAVFAVERAAGIVYRTLSGERLDLCSMG